MFSFFTTMTDSLMERLGKEFPVAHFVEAFNGVGAARMVDPQFAGGPATMFIHGVDAAAKKTVTAPRDQLGREVNDVGAVEAARAIDPLGMLRRIPGIWNGDWSPHALKMPR